MSVVYRFIIDTGAFDFGGVRHDGTQDVMGFTISRGRGGAKTGIADVGTLQMTLRSEDGRYYLNHANKVSELAIGRRVLLQMEADGKREDLFRGRITALRPVHSEDQGGMTVELEAEDDMATLAAREVDVDLIQGGILDDPKIGYRSGGFFRVVAAILEAAEWRGPVRFLGGVTSGSDFAWFEEVTPIHALSQVAEVEGGTFYIARDGGAVYESRTYRPTLRTHLDVSGRTFAYQEDSPEVVTHVQVFWTPVHDQSLQSVWERGQIRVEPNSTRLVFANFDPVVSRSIAQPRGGKEWTAHTVGDQSENRVSDVTVSVRQRFVTFARLAIKNTANVPVMVRDLKLRARPLKFGRASSVRLRSGDILTAGAVTGTAEVGSGTVAESLEGDFLYRRVEVDNDLMQRGQLARDLGQWLLKLLGRPIAQGTMTMQAHTDAQHAEHGALEIGQRVLLDRTALGVNRYFWIEHLNHAWGGGGQPLLTTLKGTPAWVVPTTGQVGAGVVGTMTTDEYGDMAVDL